MKHDVSYMNAYLVEEDENTFREMCRHSRRRPLVRPAGGKGGQDRSELGRMQYKGGRDSLTAKERRGLR